MLLGAASVAAAQQVIYKGSATPLPGGDRAMLTPMRCDAAGNIFYRGYRSPATLVPLKEITSDGKQVKTFSIPDDAMSGSLKGATARDFAITPTGKAYEVLQGPGADGSRIFVVEFDGDGKYSNAIELDGKFIPAQFAVFSTGDFLVSGAAVLHGGENPAFQSFTAVFDRSGRLVKEVDTGQPALTGSVTNGGGEKSPGKGGSSGPVPSGIAESGADFVYVLKKTGKPVLLMISPAGVVERRIALEPPPYPDASVNGFRVGAGEVLVEYIRPQADTKSNATQYFYTYETLEGERLAAYTLAPDLRGLFACPDWRGGFSFLSVAEDGQNVLLRAESR
jgi:hypothetical protein